jgi:hypothetical protein
MFSMQPLTEEMIRAAIRENARIAAVQTSATVPASDAVLNYHLIRRILLAIKTGGAERFLALEAGQPGVTAENVAAVERLQDEIIQADPKLAAMFSRLEARRNAPVVGRQRRKAPARHVEPQKASSEATPEQSSPAQPAIGYVTPKGKPHVFRLKTIAQVWKRMERFLAECTDAKPLRPVSAMLNFTETPQALAQPRVAETLERARLMLGQSRPSAWVGLAAVLPELATLTNDSLVTGGVQHQWNVAVDHFEAALDLLLAGDPWPPSLVPIASLTVMHRFHWTGTGREVNDTEASMCLTHLSSRCAITPQFLFPFESADDSFLAYLGRIKKLVPLPLSAKNFRLFQPTSRSGALVPRLFDTSTIAKVLGR